MSRVALDIARVREAKALELRLTGKTYASIGEELGVTDRGAAKAGRRALEKLLRLTAEEAETLRQLELRRLDAAQAAIWGKVKQGDLAAIDRLLRIMERRAKLLGLDAPEQMDAKQDVKLVVELHPNG